MSHKLFRLVTSLSLAAVLGIAHVSPVLAATFTVNSTSDTVDANPGDGLCATTASVCTLRAAIMEANASPGDDTITLPAGTYILTIPRTNEDVSASGDLDIRSNLTINGASANSAIVDGGGIDRVFNVFPSITVNISGVTITNGMATVDSGGGILTLGTLTLTNSSVISNTTAGGGGGIRNVGTLTLISSAIVNNTVTLSGASGAGISNEGTVTVISSNISNNLATNIGGGIANFGAMTLTDSRVSSNSPGGIVNAGTLALSGGTISDNTSSSGIINGGILNVTNTTFSGNSSPNIGGGITNGNIGTLTVTNSTFSGNSAGIFGAGIANNGRTLTVTNSTFSGNSAPSGAGIANVSDGVVTIANSTFSGNNAGYGGGFGGGGVWNEIGSTVTLRNTILANSLLGGNCAGGGTSDGGGNLSWPDTTCPGLHADPLLGPLADNGGLTQTHALLHGSQAIDAAVAANCPATDQRGVIRPQGSACDIGAFELEAGGGGGDEITIDIKPGRFPNRIKLTNNVCRDDDNVYVAILTTSAFDARTVNVSTLQLGDPNLSGKATPIKSRITDVDRDGDKDMLLTFTLCGIVTNGALNASSTELVLTGRTLQGNSFTGRDSVKVVR